jgi:alkylation response protein AidB-like acyl-CoA dehydrogenase
MDFTLLEEHRMLQDTVRRFARQELLPLEPLVLQRDTQGIMGEDLLPHDARNDYWRERERLGCGD